MKSNAATFWNFLSYNGIEIPIIQRDYAQGRDGKEELRKSFLRDLKSALDTKVQMKLDFVYGTIESGKLIPLDGQQRLTTLWLLHWYVAFRAGKLSAEVIAKLKRFTYETRISSRQFCERLAEFSVLPPANTDIADHIRNQRWVRHAWRNDPTIQSMLRMLSGTRKDKSDGVYGVFDSQQCTEYWKRLTAPDCPIVFYHLNLPGVAHPDDLYIKMNARGKPLTSFENLKADLAGYIDKFKNSSPDWSSLCNPLEGLSVRMDTSWMRLFWANKSPVNTIDEAYFAFINRFFFNEVCLDKAKDGNWLVPADKENANSSYGYLNDSRTGSDYDRKIAYTSLGFYKFHDGEIPLGVLQRLMGTMNAFCAFMDSRKGGNKRPNDLIPQCEWDKEFRFFPEYTNNNAVLKDNAGNEIRSVTVLNQPQRVVFFAVCKFFWELWELTSGGEIVFDDTKSKLEKWLRVVWNLVSVQDAEGKLIIRTFGAMRTAMDVINGLNSQDVYGCLEKMESHGDSAFDLQCREEFEKAKKIISGGEEWENKIKKAEKAAFFNGSIRFLFQDPTGKTDWEHFNTKYQNAIRYFDANGVTKEYRSNAILLRAFLARIRVDDGIWFGNGSNSWRNRVLLADKFSNVVSDLLQNEVTQSNVIPHNVTTPDWISDETLLADAIAKDQDPNGEWHIITGWQRYGDKTLTRYKRKEKGNVTHPEQIIPLDHFRNDLLAEMASEQKRGKKYFIGWSTNIDFKYEGHFFRWYRLPDDKGGGSYIYSMNERWEYRKQPDCDAEEKMDCDNDYCFKVGDEEDPSTFKGRLNKLKEI